jgi:hypothetical protein
VHANVPRACREWPSSTRIVQLPRIPPKRQVLWPPFPLLRLPAELRVRIYELVVQGLRDDQAKRHGTGDFHVLRRYDIPMHPAQDYRGLTQVCRQLLTEFRPLYGEAKAVYVSVFDAREYVNGYYTEKPKVYDAHAVVLRIVLEHPSSGTIRPRASVASLGRELDILPLLSTEFEKQIKFSFSLQGN